MDGDGFCPIGIFFCFQEGSGDEQLSFFFCAQDEEVALFFLKVAACPILELSGLGAREDFEVVAGGELELGIGGCVGDDNAELKGFFEANGCFIGGLKEFELCPSKGGAEEEKEKAPTNLAHIATLRQAFFSESARAHNFSHPFRKCRGFCLRFLG